MPFDRFGIFAWGVRYNTYLWSGEPWRSGADVERDALQRGEGSGPFTDIFLNNDLLLPISRQFFLCYGLHLSGNWSIEDCCSWDKIRGVRAICSGLMMVDKSRHLIRFALLIV